MTPEKLNEKIACLEGWERSNGPQFYWIHPHDGNGKKAWTINCPDYAKPVKVLHMLKQLPLMTRRLCMMHEDRIEESVKRAYYKMIKEGDHD